MMTAGKARFVASSSSPVSVTNLLQRRCIHDEYGRIDPVKAQERSKPRGSISVKRARPTDDDGYPFANKKPKQESNSPVSRPAILSGTGGGDSSTHAVSPSAYAHEAMHFKEDTGPPQAVAETEEKTPFGQSSYASPPAFQTDAEETNEMGSAPARSRPTATLVSPPTSLSDEPDLPHEHANGDVHVSNEGEHSALYTPNSGSRHSSRQPRLVDRYAPEAIAKGSKPPSSHTPARRPPGIATTASQRTSPVLSSGVKKPSSRPTSSHTKKSPWPGPERKADRQASLPISPGQSSKHAKRDRVHLAENEMDPDTMRAIREIQEEQFGLRRRGTRA